MKVLELFAGVGGFRIGLENADKQLFKNKMGKPMGTIS